MLHWNSQSKFAIFKMDPKFAIFFKSMGFKDIKYDIPVCHEGHEGPPIQRLSPTQLAPHSIGPQIQDKLSEPSSCGRHF